MGFLKDYLPSYQRTTTIALAAIMAALVCVVTYSFFLIIAATGGFFNLGDAIIFIAAILFGPIIGGFAGGVGAALADVLLGFGNFAPGTLVIKFCEGFIVGYLIYRVKLHSSKREVSLLTMVIAVLIGGFIMVTGYFVYEWTLVPGDLGAAMFELPWNIGQALIGLAIAIPISIRIERSLQLDQRFLTESPPT